MEFSQITLLGGDSCTQTRRHGDFRTTGTLSYKTTHFPSWDVQEPGQIPTSSGRTICEPRAVPVVLLATPPQDVDTERAGRPNSDEDEATPGFLATQRSEDVRMTDVFKKNYESIQRRCSAQNLLHWISAVYGEGTVDLLVVSRSLSGKVQQQGGICFFGPCGVFLRTQHPQWQFDKIIRAVISELTDGHFPSSILDNGYSTFISSRGNPKFMGSKVQRKRI
ncbi:hypothetical protein B0H14DRAFT_3642482 [Mycena olivaceomarginata]|nr:hypothetical protein B0H14DRAFT_3642482 [Mycena olivaceomarginata]